MTRTHTWCIEVKVLTNDTNILYKKKVIGLCERENNFP